MGRVERRMYKRRRKRAFIKRVILLLILVIAVLLAARMMTHRRMTAQRIGVPTPTPIASTYDTTMETRDVELSEEVWYAIQTGVFSTREAALEKADAYNDRGAPGMVIQDGVKWRVFIACYGSSEEASAVRTRLGEVQRVETYLYEWHCPELRLRLTGQAGQLDTVEAGLPIFVQTAARLRNASMLLDAGEWTVNEVLSEVNAIDGQLKLWQKTTESRFGKTSPDLVRQLFQRVDSWSQICQRVLSNADTATALSAELKIQAMHLFDEEMKMRNSIGDS